MSPAEFAPTDQNQLQWPMWGQHYQTQGEAGQAPDLPEAAELLGLFGKWRTATTPDERRDIWQRMLSIYSAQIYSIGLIAGILQPVAVRKTLHNVPAEGVYNWEPGAQFGIYRPDTFWFEKAG
jgi:peptide/nickel transport system substrate-binding protein